MTNSPGTIDSSYRGQVILALYNKSDEMQHVDRLERVAQIIIQPYANVSPVEVDELNRTERGAGGFGSSGTFGRL